MRRARLRALDDGVYAVEFWLPTGEMRSARSENGMPWLIDMGKLVNLGRQE